MKNYDAATQNNILHQVLDMGENLLSAGAEVKRVENTIVRLGMAYGAARMDVLVITASIIVTMTFPDGREFTQTRRILNPAATDLNKLEKLNALSRICCEKGMSPDELRTEMEKIVKEPGITWSVYLGSVIAASAFSLFFGGRLADGIAAGLFAVLICFLQDRLSPRCPNRVIFNLLCSLIAGLGIYGVTSAVSFLQADKIIVGDIMLLIPGIAITNAVKDMLVGDTIAGTMRFLESLLWAGALAGGFMASIWIMGG